MSSVFQILDVCTEPAILRIINFVQILLRVVFIVAPIAMIIMLSIDMGKNVIAQNENDMTKNLTLAARRIIYYFILFFVPTIINISLSLVDDTISNINVEYNSCLSNVKNIPLYDKLKEIEKAHKEKENLELIMRAEEEAKAKNKEESSIKRSRAARIKAEIAMGGNTTSSTTGTVLGTKYQLSDDELRGIANLCEQEQGSAIGAAAEASLMANRYELWGSDSSSLYSYVANSGWWAGASRYLQGTPSPDVLAAVKEVLVLGNRTLDLYVDEHDCIDCGSYGFDIIKLVTDGEVITDHASLKDHSNYIKDKTVIYNKYTGVYTFSAFPTPSSDPFGYTAEAKSKYDILNK